MKFYAVAKGKAPGVYTTWPEAQKQVVGFKGAVYKSFATRQEAFDFVSRVQDENLEGVAAYAPVQVEHKGEGTVVYTDGSFREGRCGYGVVVLKGEEKHLVCGRVPVQLGCTNNVAELYAIHVALSLLPREDITIFTDSQYCMLCLTKYDPKWGPEKPNSALIHLNASLMKGRNVVFKHVRAHVGHELNELVDQLAEKGRAQDEHFVHVTC